VFADLAQFFVG
jgi:hypothetical protein